MFVLDGIADSIACGLPLPLVKLDCVRQTLTVQCSTSILEKRKERICSLGRLQGQSLVSRLLHLSGTVSHPSGTVTQPGAKDWSGAVSMELLGMVLAPVKAYLVLGRAVDSAAQIYGN